MDASAVRFPTRNLIFDDVRMVGFWLDLWRRKPVLLISQRCGTVSALGMTEQRSTPLIGL